MKKNEGYLVVTKTGKKGRTYCHKGLVNGKVPVYLEVSTFKYSGNTILCNPDTLKIIGFID